MYSVVIPVYNEAGNLRALHRRLLTVMAGLDGSFELIFVNDGSHDDSAKILQALRPATIITLRKNFGQTAALDAGFKHAQGDIIITLDGDLQNPPEEIPKLLAYLREHKLDVVSGWRKQRQDSFMKRFVSRGAYALRSFFINDGIHDSGCTLKVYRRDCLTDLDLFGEIHRFIPGLLQWQGFSIGELEVAHAARANGHSKYNSNRILKGFVDMVGLWFWRKYSSRPLHLFGGTGVFLTVLGVIMLVALAVARFVWQYPLSTSIWPLMAILFILVGIQLFITGLLAEVLIKNYYRERLPYSIARVERQ
jgi:glycosyltransferase involved in cell wall biosynthesis